MTFAMVARGQLPAGLAAINPERRTPVGAILVTGAAMLALSLSGTFLYLLTISTLAPLITYLASCGALPILRRRNNAPAAVFSLPAGCIVAFAGMIACLCLLSSSTFREARDTAIVVLIALVLSLIPFKHPARNQEAIG